jgi:hypothetical protein
LNIFKYLNQPLFEIQIVAAWAAGEIILSCKYMTEGDKSFVETHRIFA